MEPWDFPGTNTHQLLDNESAEFDSSSVQPSGAHETEPFAEDIFAQASTEAPWLAPASQDAQDLRDDLWSMNAPLPVYSSYEDVHYEESLPPNSADLLNLQASAADLMNYIVELQARSADLVGSSVIPSFHSASVDHGYSQKELVYLKAALQPLHDLQADGSSAAAGETSRGRAGREMRRGLSTSTPGARNSSISTEPQSVAARHRRGRIRDKLRELQQLVPGGGSMDTASMLEEAALYVAFLKAEVEHLRQGTSRLPLLLTRGL